MLTVNLVTSNQHKSDENNILRDLCLSDGTPVSALFSFKVWNESITEHLEVDLRKLVREEALKAYERLKVACVVEHAGVILVDHLSTGYPGGLTKAMWNTLGKDRFVSELATTSRAAVARAVVGYCDGMTVRTFVGETNGSLAVTPRGSRSFYWDQVFEPDGEGGLTYSELVASKGLRYKVERLSQSTKAMMLLLEYLRVTGMPAFWR